MANYSQIALDIIYDCDKLMGTYELYMLGGWIKNATNWASN